MLPFQIEAMETKVSALNNLLHTDSKPSSSTSSPATAQKHKKSSVKKMIKKMSRKSTKKLSEPKVPEVPEPILKPGELMSQDFKEFKQWMEKGLPISLHEPGEETYWKSVYSLQISPCLSFSNKQVSKNEKIILSVKPSKGYFGVKKMGFVLGSSFLKV